VVLFELTTFLVIAHATLTPHADAHRFEKISNIIKQFKLSCRKAQAQFEGASKLRLVRSFRDGRDGGL
jgi:Ras-related GTP-binding protein A/B